MFDHEGVKITKMISSLSILFLHVKSKKLVTKNYEDKGLNMLNPNQFLASQSLLKIFFK